MAVRKIPSAFFIKSFIFILLAVYSAGCNNSSLKSDMQNIPTDNKDDILWYNEPAAVWEEALPLGNGRIGAMVFGGTDTAGFQLNDDSMWPEDTKWPHPEGNKDDLNKIRQLLFEGKNHIADSLYIAKFSNLDILRSHQTMGDLKICLDHKNITDYKRQLNLNQAAAYVYYKYKGYPVESRSFISYPHQVMVIEYKTGNPEGLSGKILLSRPKDNGFPTSITKATADDILVMEGEVTQRGGIFRSQSYPILNGVKFQTVIKTVNEGGELTGKDDFLEFKNVKALTVYLVENSSYYFEDYKKQNQINLTAALKETTQSIFKQNAEDHNKYYSRVEFSLGSSEADTVPTNIRLEKIKTGYQDHGIEELLFQYGRYLLICGSRPGTNPLNLQGLWNRFIQAPWNADYHLNINFQMNYWLADITNLSEFYKPFFTYADKLIKNGKQTAGLNYGCNGTFIPHASDLWAPTWLQAATAYWGCSVGAGGWLAQHYWNHFLYTNDYTFLEKQAYPAIKEIAEFYSDWLITDPRDGYLISAPSTSPENQFINTDGKEVATCLGSAMDQQIVHEVFTNFISACNRLNIKNELLDKITAQLKKLRPGFVIGSDGRILEWDREYKEPEPGHRHMSHLYGFHPGSSVSIETDPAIFDAVKKTLDYRLNNGGAGTGWSRAWLVNLSARLLNGNMAYEHIQMLLKKSLYKNLFDAHPPFQIDGNFGFTAGVAEMLLQSHETGIIRILPALPDKWENGFVTGLKARGGLTFDLYWKNGNPDKIIIKSENPVSFKLKYGNIEKKISLGLNETKILHGKNLAD